MLRERLLAYLPALALGLALVALLFPMDFLWPRAGLDWRPVGDAAQHAIAQRHFLAAPWAWPPLDVPSLPGGHLAFLDGIPLQALALKLVRGWLPEGFHGIGLFYATAWVLQPVAAVWALRGFGVRGFVPAAAVALMAVSMPAFILRFGHAALTGHFVLLAALGLYARVLGDARWWFVAVPFQAAALLIHPYLALMSLALLAAAPLTALLRGENWVRHAIGAAAAALAMFVTMAAFGYLGATGDGGYGMFALNLLSPLWPYRSLWLGWLVAGEVDATGHGGWEGYNWLGLGLWLAIIITILWCGRAVLRGLRAEAGLTLALLALTLLALSWRVGFGHAVLLDLGPPPGFLEQFRASGRFFWPVGYALMIGVAVLLAQRGRAGVALLGLAAALQFADAAPMRAALAQWTSAREGWSMDAGALRPALREAARHGFYPSWACIPKPEAASRVRLLEWLLLASESPRPVNTMYVARWRGRAPDCGDAATLSVPPAPGELRALLDEAAVSAGNCVAFGGYRLCR
jgi:hypothetical protein